MTSNPTILKTTERKLSMAQPPASSIMPQRPQSAIGQNSRLLTNNGSGTAQRKSTVTDGMDSSLEGGADNLADTIGKKDTRPSMASHRSSNSAVSGSASKAVA